MNLFNTQPTGDEEACRIARELIRIDTTNYGAGNAVGEQKAAEYVAGLLAEVGLESQSYEAAPGRTNLIARWKGLDPNLPALLFHGHLDVVPADASQWSVPPFEGVIKDGMLWGRGAVDMKNMVAMIIAAVRGLIAEGFTPKRDIILAFFADEEANSALGSQWMVEHHPEVFAGVDIAISEVGGYSVYINGQPVFLIQTGEKGLLWLRLRCCGRAGHASQRNDQNAILELAQAISRIGSEAWPVSLTPTTSRLLDELRKIANIPETTEPLEVVKHTGTGQSWVAPGFFNVANVTMFQAGVKENVVPGEASALIDVRVLPGQRETVLARITELAGPKISLEIESEVEAVEADFDAPIVEAMRSSLIRFLPEARIAPYLLPAGTDNALLAKLGIQGYGFVPLLLPETFDFPAMFHGVDERVPLSSLVFGEAVLRELIRIY
jgi:acetylornithine deacetylase/succinyl-diaminopimelate desuccinylase-like protein